MARSRKKPRIDSGDLVAALRTSMTRSLQSAIQYAGHALPWQIQIPLFLCIFVAVGTFCSIPSETFPKGFTVNQALEDFGVFLLFTALWAGIYAHFRRDINIFWLVLLFAAALIQEEINIWNKLLFAFGDTFGARSIFRRSWQPIRTGSITSASKIT